MGRIYDATWGRAFSALYDSCMKGTEEAGMREKRRELLAQASGRTIEVGAGTGLNLDLYPDAVSELVLTEPDPHMVKQLRKRVAGATRTVSISEAGAEKLPFPDGSFDTAIVTLVLCTVPDPVAGIAEVSRVLKPGGRFLFLEHVRSEDPGLARWQDRLERPWRFAADGCHCNRDTVAMISASPLQIDQVESDELPKAPPLIRPLVIGRATRPA
jgi:ubiquinone/menaquinone biosynthesis C-methylase UbiE